VNEAMALRDDEAPVGVTAAWHLRLYVAGQRSKSLAAVRNLKLLCETYLRHGYEIEVVDLLERPQLAAEEQIIAIPTLIRARPAPQRKIVGDLSDHERVAHLLDMTAPPRGGAS
jgi:circadian clock protein KaiB